MATPIWPIEGVALDSTGDMVTGSLADRVTLVGDYFSERGRVYPTMAAGATVISANADWTLGAVAQIVPASAITVDYFLHAMIIETCNQNAVFELVLYQGAGDTEISRIRFAVAGGFFGNAYYTMNGPVVPANARLRAALASSDGLANQATITMSVAYHETT